MTRSLPSDQKQGQSPILNGHPTLSNLPAPIDRNAKPSTAPATGSPKCPPRQSYSFKPEDDILVQPVIQIDSPEPNRTANRPISPPPTPPQTPSQSKSLNDLPTEIQESILNHIAGSLGTPNSSHGSRSWNSRMRHPRRKDLSDLSLVSQTWRSLVQGRLYRHLKIKGTVAELSKCCHWFMENPRFRSYVKHVEIWVPLFEMATAPRSRTPLRAPPNPRNQDASIVLFGLRIGPNDFGPVLLGNHSTTNATLEDIFDYATVVFPEACALTIEGGHCKKSRKIQHYRTPAPAQTIAQPPVPHPLTLNGSTYPTFFPHTKIQTLILKGSWNIIREASDFQNLALALPYLKEWHCVYAKPKTDGYKAMCGVLRHFPPTITKINICLEGLNGKQPSSLAKWRKIYPAFHICKDMGRLFPQLESLTFTGHVCACLFRSAMNAVSALRDYPKLRSIDLFVRNCCRDSTDLDDGPSIHNWPFIQAFEQLVVEAVSALGVYPQLSYMRIRFLDLDSPRPLLNPYFHFENDVCTGMWDRKILDALAEARPNARFDSTTDDGILEWLEGPIFSRPKSMKAASYAALAQGGVID